MACKTEKFLFYTSADTAVWILVVFTIDRFIAVCYPLKKTNFCRSSRAKVSCAIVLATAAVKNLHVLGTRGSQYRLDHPINRTTETVLVSNCGKPNAACEYFEDFVRPWIAFVAVSLLPFCVIILCNVFIVAALLRVRKLRAKHCVTSTSDKSLIQMTAMCLSASFCFLVCVAPSIILLIGKPYWKRSNPASYEITKVVNNQLVFVNHSVNFFLYCVTGRRFRRGIWTVFRCGGHSPVDSAATDGSFESRTTLAKLAPSPEHARRTSATNVRSVMNRSASLGAANVVFKKTASDFNAASSGPRDTLVRSKSILPYESAI